MKILDRYVSKQLALTTAIAVSVLSVVLVLGNVFRQIFELLINKNAPYEFLLTFVEYIIPFSMIFTLPWGFLTAVLLVFGRMSAEHELTALRSSGVSILRICAAVFGIAGVCVAACLWINLEVAPRAQARFKLALYELAINRPLSMFDGDRVIDSFPNLKIYIGRNDGRELHNLIVYELGGDSEPQKVIFARRGRIHSDPANRRLLLDLFDARYEQRDASAPQAYGRIRQGITMQQTTLPISLEELYERNQRRRPLSSLTLAELQAVLRDGRAEEPGSPLLSIGDLSETRVELHKRFSLSLASLALGLMAIPLAVSAQRKETAAGFLLSLLLAFAYFFLIIMTGWVKSRPEFYPHLLVWVPNVLFFSLGGSMFKRLARR
jgi:lipopolysaccharide export system permease protein